jgi:hypothetical protein
MPNDFATAADLLKFNNMNARDVGASQLLLETPLLNALSAITATQGNKHTFLRDLTAPTVGFRPVNTGRDLSKSAQEEVSVDLKIMSANSAVDSRLAEIYPAAKGGRAGYVARDMRIQLAAALLAAEAALVQGDGAGFVGLQQALPNLSAANAANKTVIGAGGVTADTGLTSVYFIRTNDLETDVNLVLGNDGVMAIGDTWEQFMSDGAGRSYPALATTCEGWVGLVIHSQFSVYRIANINGTNKSVTDDLLSRAWENIPEGKEPTFILMNKRSGAQLQRSRVATSQTGGAVPFPRDYENVPIIYSRAITNAETQVT